MRKLMFLKQLVSGAFRMLAAVDISSNLFKSAGIRSTLDHQDSARKMYHHDSAGEC